MGLFNKSKSNSVVWRNKEGKVECPGDSCPKDCDLSCPIWCQTEGLQLMQIGEIDMAIEKFKKALALAPDYKEAWNNLGFCYGYNGDDLEANKAYMEAYKLDNKYRNAMYGLIVSFFKLGKLVEALQYCDKFEALFGKAEADALRNKLRGR